jgi:hypothetical protein
MALQMIHEFSKEEAAEIAEAGVHIELDALFEERRVFDFAHEKHRREQWKELEELSVHFGECFAAVLERCALVDEEKGRSSAWDDTLLRNA